MSDWRQLSMKSKWEATFPIRIGKLLATLEDLANHQDKIAAESPDYMVPMSRIFESKAEAYRLLKPLVEALLEDK